MNPTRNRVVCAASVALCAGTAFGQTGACCLMDGACSVLTSAACSAQGGVYRGNSTTCATANCPQPLPRLWLAQFGTNSSERAEGVAADNTGGCFVAGAWGNDAFVARYDRNGVQQWIRQTGTTRTDYWRGATPDGAGGVYVTGTYDSGQVSPMLFVFGGRLSRYDSAGTELWGVSVAPGLLNYRFPNAVAADANSVYVAGSTSIGGVPSSNDAFLCRFNTAGAPQWARVLSSGTAFDDGFAVASDGAGGAYVAGSTEGSFAGTNLGVRDMFLARYDSAGNQLWIRQYGTTASDSANGLTLFNGSALLCGSSGGDLFATNRGSNDAIVMLVNNAGNTLWARQFGSTGNDGLTSITVSSAGTIIAGGATTGSLVGTNAGGNDAFLAAFDTFGVPLWIRQFGTTSSDIGYDVAPDASGGVYFAGETNGALAPMPPGSTDAFLARYSPPCYANCDASTIVPILNVNDFTCFLNRFAAGSSLANCDASTIAPVLNVNDFTCFSNRYATGCP